MESDAFRPKKGAPHTHDFFDGKRHFPSKLEPMMFLTESDAFRQNLKFSFYIACGAIQLKI